jgi:hypothetical protein
VRRGRLGYTILFSLLSTAGGISCTWPLGSKRSTDAASSNVAKRKLVLIWFAGEQRDCEVHMNFKGYLPVLRPNSVSASALSTKSPATANLYSRTRR